jgi:hypothetical protein
MLASIFELDSRAGDEILDCARDKHLTRPREGRDSRADVNRDPADLVVD